MNCVITHLLSQPSCAVSLAVCALTLFRVNSACSISHTPGTCSPLHSLCTSCLSLSLSHTYRALARSLSHIHSNSRSPVTDSTHEGSHPLSPCALTLLPNGATNSLSPPLAYTISTVRHTQIQTHYFSLSLSLASFFTHTHPSSVITLLP